MQTGDTSYTDSSELKTIRKYCGIKGLYLFNIIEQLIKKGEKQETLLREFDVNKFTKYTNKNIEDSKPFFESGIEQLRKVVSDLLQNYADGVQNDLPLGLLTFFKYYVFIEDGTIEFNIHRDLSELLIVDLAVSQLVLSAGSRLGESDLCIKEIKRAGKHREVTNSKINTRWEKICITLNKMKDDEKYQERSFSISGISSIIHPILEVDKQTIIRDFTNHLGNKITGKKYQISDLLNMCCKS